MASWITSPVEFRVLSSTVVVRGDVEPEVLASVGVPVSVEGVGVVTRVPPSVGSEVAEGDVVVEVSGRPVFVLQGEVPVYRSLKPGMEGADVAQLQAALTRLGFAPETDGVYGTATKAAVTELYEQAGFEPVASTVTAAEVAAGLRALQDAEAAVDAAEAALARAQSGSSSSSVVAAQAGVDAAARALSDAQAAKVEAVANVQAALTAAQNAYNATMADPNASQADKDAANAALVQANSAYTAAVRDSDTAIANAKGQLRVAEATLREAKADNDVAAATQARDNAVLTRDSAAEAYLALQVATGATVAQGEVVFVPTMPARVQAAVAALGPIGATDPFGGDTGTGDLVTLAAGRLLVTTGIRSPDQPLIRVGMEVALLDEITNTTYPATVTSIATASVIDPSGQTTYPAVITPDDPLPDNLTGANLRVTITSAASDGAALVVPLAAVSSDASGGQRVSVLPDGTDDPVDVAVTVGISADGFIAVEPVEPGALGEGDKVVVGR